MEIDIKLCEEQIDLILKSMELYAFNLHHTWQVKVDEDKQELRNAILFHTYEQLISSKINENYRIGYDVSKNCKSLINNKKKKIYYANRKSKIA